MTAATPGDGTPEEREVKLPFPSVGEALRAVEAAGAESVAGWSFEDNVVLDDAARTLGRRGLLLRVRSETPCPEGGRPADDAEVKRGRLTFKGPSRVDAGMKVREELELDVSDPSILRLLLERIGYESSFRYQKRRCKFRRGDAVIVVDDTPMGAFVEVEGSIGEIDAITAEMGCDRSRWLTDSYAGLWRRDHEGDMLLDDPEPTP